MRGVLLLIVIAIGTGSAGCGRRAEVVELRRAANLESAYTVWSVESNRALSEGIRCLRSERYADAADYFRQSEAADSSNWMAPYYLGLAATRLDHESEAETALHRALELAPQDYRTRSRIYVALADLAVQQGDQQRARLNYLMAFRLCPESSDAVAGLQNLGGLPDDGQ